MNAQVWRRGAEEGANPRGGKVPYVSPDGSHTIVDLIFKNPLTKRRWDDGFVLFGKPASAYQVAEEVSGVDGVLCHGVVTSADAVVVAAGVGNAGDGAARGPREITVKKR